ncbi:hypothetical protein GGR57DRAFT_513133 [Xylariaceae sp. FL1272]|nr:hypothetical protein GGR57DRAFT_513133 [Xylariaceae sp. FL1272]
MGNRLRVMRKRRARSLQSKIIDYAELFSLNVELVAQDKTSGDYEVFQPRLDKNFPPARNDIYPRILHIGDEKVKVKGRKAKTKTGGIPGRPTTNGEVDLTVRGAQTPQIFQPVTSRRWSANEMSLKRDSEAASILNNRSLILKYPGTDYHSGIARRNELES